MKKTSRLRSLLLAAILPLAASPSLRASDHADGPTVAGDQACDLADCYMFLDPNDATKIVIINTVRGFIVPGEAVNFVVFDSNVRYRFQIENTGDPKPDAFLDVRFSEKVADPATGAPLPQNVTVVASGKFGLKGKFTGTTVNPTLGAAATAFPMTPQVLKDKNGADSTIEFYAGETDDPFFFDIPGFARWKTSIIAGMRDDTKLNRGRDTFAGYNVLTIAFRVPLALVQNPKTVDHPEVVGLNVLAQRQTEHTSKGRKLGKGPFTTVDREGLPAVNALLVPLNLKNAFNGATTIDDSKGKFAAAITDSLMKLGTDQAHIDVLAGLAVSNGDILRLDTTVPAAFPNGRAPVDDVVKTLLTVINNGTTIDDSVAANDVAFATVFPYLGLPQQPRNPNMDPVLNVDDNTRN